MKLRYLLPVLILTILLTAGFAQQPSGNLVEVAANNEELSTFVLALETAGLADTLRNSEVNFTVFAPTDEAFVAGLDAVGLSLDDLLTDNQRLTQVLQYHVIGTTMDADMLIDNTAANGAVSLTTLEGSELMLMVNDNGISINADPVLQETGSTVIQADLTATNGVIHIIDRVLMPQPAQSEVEVPTATMRIAHLSPDAPPIDIYLDGALSDIGALAYPDVTGWIEVPAGTHEIALVPFGEALSAAAIGPLDLTFDANTWTTISAVGLFEQDTLKANVFLEERALNFADDQARVTVYHSIADAQAVDVLADGDVLISGLAFPGSQGDNDGVFVVDVPAATYDLTIVPTGETEPVILDLPGTELAAGTYYFIAVIGSQADPDTYVETFTPSQLTGEQSMSSASESILDNAIGDDDLTIFVAALAATDLSDVMHSDGPFTVFAPTNAAFDTALETLDMTEEELLGNTALLENVLRYHVLTDTQTTDDLMTLITEAESEQMVSEFEQPTLQGDPIILSIVDGELSVNGSTIVESNVEASNGIIHIIDAVLLPPTTDVE